MKKGMLILLTFLLFSTCVYSVKDLMALQGSVKDLGGNPVYGNITVTIHNDPLGGTQIYNSGTDFYGNINNGQYDLMLGSGSNELELEFGKHYYVDLIINGEDIDFDGNERFRFQSSTGTIKNINLSGDNLSIMNGNVGIGTTSPGAKLEVYDNGISSTFDANDKSTWVAMQIDATRGITGGARGIEFHDTSSSTKSAGIFGISKNPTGGRVELGFITSSGNSAYERMRIDEYGNVGIGTASPSYKLHVTGNMMASIMYDYNNAGYYVDPSSTSNVYRVDAANQMRTPIMYDSDNTGYYINPAGTSNFNYIRLGGVNRNSWPSSGCTLGLGSCTWTGVSGTGQTSCSGSRVVAGIEQEANYDSGSEVYDHIVSRIRCCTLTCT